MTLPFKQKDIYLGLAEISGLLRVAQNVLEIEYQVKDTTLGLMDSSVKSCHIPFHIIESIEVEEGWFSGKLELTFNRIPDLDNPFQLDGNSLKLSVNKRDLEKAKTFRSKLMVEIMERKIDELDNKNDQETEKGSFSENYTSQPSSRTRSTKQSVSGGLENMLREE